MTLSPLTKKVILSPWLRLSMLVLISIIVFIQVLQLDEVANFIIFKTSSERFLNHENLYDFIEYGIIYDKFFYSPQFTVLFLPFALLPLKFSIFLWLLSGALLFHYALQKLPLTNIQKTIIFFIALIDLVNSLQNLQTNALNTALMLLIFAHLHNREPLWAALCTALCLSIKIYPAATALLFLFYPGKIKFMLYTALFTILLFALPLAIGGKEYYFSCLHNWFHTLAEDTNMTSVHKSPSLIGINYTWFAHPVNHFYIQAGGLLFVFLPLIKLYKKNFDLHFILFYLGYIMLSVVLFNHAAESPTYIIAITGAAIWYILSHKTFTNNMLLIILFAGCILLPTDIYPKWLRVEYLAEYKLRVIPCLLVWMILLFKLLAYKKQEIKTVPV